MAKGEDSSTPHDDGPPEGTTRRLGPDDASREGPPEPSRPARLTATPGKPQLPERIGHYRVLGLIGEGGMGTVYEAEQENPKRTVALKVVRTGLTSEKALRRFEHEAQVLGKLQHPGIAQVFEAGTAETASGQQPFFAMELIRGDTLREYLRRSSPSIRQRLELIASVCDAVQHAHQKGVIHRDLKPSNILVDESAQPKVLDFGVARVTDSDIQLTTMQTGVGQLIGTVQYMSPEQAAADPDELDTRSDVYALGVVLYEVLADKLPYEIPQRNIHEAVRVIREQEPTSLSSVSKVFRGDIETIVAKALEKDKSRRYESAEQLAADVRRHLRDEPIVARPPTTLYQLRKFAKRNKTLVGGVVTAFVALSVGLGVAVSQYIRAESERGIAEEARDESEAVTEFLEGMLSSVAPGERGRDVTVREILDESAKTIDEKFQGQPLIEARLRHTIGDAYRSLRANDPALLHLERAVETRRNTLGEDHMATLESSDALAFVYSRTDRQDEGESILLRNLETRTRRLGAEHPETLKAARFLAYVYWEQGRYAESDSLYEKTLEVSRRALGDDHIDTLDCLFRVALARKREFKIEEAVPLYEEFMRGTRRALGEDHELTLNAIGNLALARHWQGMLAEAESLYVEAVQASLRVLGSDHRYTMSWEHNLAVFYRQQGRVDEAESIHRRLLETRRRVLGDDHWDTLASMNALGFLYAFTKRFEAAEALYREEFEIERRTFGADHPWTLRAMEQLALLYNDWERPDDARSLYAELIPLRKQAAERSGDASQMEALAGLLLTCEPADLRDPKEALRLAIQANDLMDNENGHYLDTLALAYHQTGQTDKAIEIQRKVLALVPGSDPFRAIMEEHFAEFEAALKEAPVKRMPGGDR